MIAVIADMGTVTTPGTRPHETTIAMIALNDLEAGAVAARVAGAKEKVVGAGKEATADLTAGTVAGTQTVGKPPTTLDLPAGDLPAGALAERPSHPKSLLVIGTATLNAGQIASVDQSVEPSVIAIQTAVPSAVRSVVPMAAKSVALNAVVVQVRKLLPIKTRAAGQAARAVKAQKRMIDLAVQIKAVTARIVGALAVTVLVGVALVLTELSRLTASALVAARSQPLTALPASALAAIVQAVTERPVTALAVIVLAVIKLAVIKLAMIKLAVTALEAIVVLVIVLLVIGLLAIVLAAIVLAVNALAMTGLAVIAQAVSVLAVMLQEVKPKPPQRARQPRQVLLQLRQPRQLLETSQQLPVLRRLNNDKWCAFQAR
mmetsp:Transcript_123354/g.217430  ORF Transcript_123354/g.217430 Transcript_123354/m.217430 type:complete len:375 (+) Transcript_123354:145-1269(+)